MLLLSNEPRSSGTTTKDTLSNVRKEATLKYPLTGAYLEVDFLLPDLNLCFEFQDTYHYVTTWIKNSVALLNGLTLIEIPCWWDGSAAGLAAAVHFYRPDLDQMNHNDESSLIPFNPHRDFFPYPLVEGVGELMLASFPIDHKFSVDSQEIHWWIGEKYDGIRCCWNPESRLTLTECRYTRSAKVLPILESLTCILPGLSVDAEFWFGRGQFAGTFTLVKKNVEFVSWHLIRIMSFDAPAFDLQTIPFEERYRVLIIVAPRMLCLSDQHLREMVKNLIESGGEGVILRKHFSLYDHGRSQNLLKLKTAQGDMEGIVEAIDKNRSVLLKLPNDQRIAVPVEDVDITKPNVGDIVSFTYVSHARREQPVDPKIFRIRTDVSWEEVVLSYNKERRFLNDSSQVSGFASQPLNHWTKETIRVFLETFTNSRGMDPLLADTWYNISAHDIRQVKGGNTIMGRVKGGYYNTLKWIFPEINFDPSVFQRYSWRNVDNRKRFFENYAKEMEFDPHIADNWYTQPTDVILSFKGASSVLFYHRHSVAKALLDLFPDIGLERVKFRSVWRDGRNRRKYFENFARKWHFDPLLLDDWTTERRERLKTMKDAIQVLLYHHSSVSRALLDLFPELALDETVLRNPRSFWNDPANRRIFFENYAKKYKFEVKDPDNWYMQDAERMFAQRSARRVFSYYRNSIAQALVSLFPEVTFDTSRFGESTLGTHMSIIKKNASTLTGHLLNNDRYESSTERRMAFEEVARQRSLDPLIPDTWYLLSKENILSNKVHQVLSFYRCSITRALLDLFPQIGLSKSKLKVLFYWCDRNNRRRFFEKFAFTTGFDALQPENWYSQPRELIVSAKGAGGVLHYYSHSVSKALLDLFPEIGLESSKFDVVGQVNYFSRETAMRKRFFEKFAQESGFDAHNPLMWYSQAKQSILSAKGASNILSYYNYNVANALVHLFPSIGLDKTRFKCGLNSMCTVVWHVRVLECSRVRLEDQVKGVRCACEYPLHCQHDKLLEG